MNIERAERLYHFIAKLPPQAIQMHMILDHTACGTVGCWGGWATVCFQDDMPQGKTEPLAEYVCRVLEISNDLFQTMYSGTWSGHPMLFNIKKDHLLEEWRARIAYARRERIIDQMRYKASNKHKESTNVASR